MIYKCEYCKTHTAHSEGMRMECVNCGAALKDLNSISYIIPQGTEIIEVMNLPAGMNFIEYKGPKAPVLMGI